MTSAAILNAVAFQVCWFACILGAARGWPWLGPVSVAVFGTAHIRLGVRPEGRWSELSLLATAAVFGYLADSALVLTGVLRFPDHASLGWPSAAWMVALWVGLAATLRSSMAWLQHRLVLAAVFGALGGPAAYLAGQRFGAAFLGPSQAVAMAVIAIEWMVAMPALVWMAGRWNVPAREATT